MRVLDLFSGLGGFSQAFKERGHEVITVDIEEKFKPTICSDIMELGPEDFPGEWDIILASPPCNCFSLASCPVHWKPDMAPGDKQTIKSIAIVYYTIWLIKSLRPRYWIIENPRAQLRNILGLPKAEITLCQYHVDKNMEKKPPQKYTDLWGTLPNFPIRHCKNGDSCHEPAPRGSNGGTQGLPNAETRAKLPYGLSLEICKAVEGDIPKETLTSY